MHPVEIDIACLEPAKRLLAGGDNRFAVGAAAVGIASVHAAEELGGEDDAIALAGMLAEVIADDLFRMSLGIGIGGVDEVAAFVDESVENRFRVLHGRSPSPVFAEGHRPETERRNTKSGVAERDVMIEGHVRFPGLADCC